MVGPVNSQSFSHSQACFAVIGFLGPMKYYVGFILMDQFMDYSTNPQLVMLPEALWMESQAHWIYESMPIKMSHSFPGWLVGL